MWKLNIEQHGFAIIPNVLSSEEIVGLGLLFENAPAKRSRAGVRHAMGIPEVESLALGKELRNISRRQSSAAMRCHFVQLCSINRPRPTGSWFGIRIRHYPYASGESKPDGGHGPSRTECFMRMLRPVHLRKYLPCASISTIQPSRMDRCGCYPAPTDRAC